MKHQDIREFWNIRCSGLLLAVSAIPIISLAWFSSDPQRQLALAASLDGLIRGPAAVVATVCLYVAWRLSARCQLAWAAAIAAVIAVQAVVSAALQLTSIDQTLDGSLWLVVFDALSALVIGRLAVSAMRHSAFSAPVPLGVAAGLALGAGRVLSLLLLPQIEAAHVGRPVLVLTFALLLVPTLLLIALLPDLPGWASSRLGAAVSLYGLGHLSASLAGRSGAVTRSVITLTADLGGAVFLCAAAIGLLKLTIGAAADDRDQLQLRVDELEAGVRRDRSRIHEINSTIAGVASASRLLHEDHTIDQGRRRLLENMVRTELGRLQRLLNEPSAARAASLAARSVPVEVDLDSTISNLVLAHEARGNRVHWLPSGARIAGEPDQVAEVLNILLDNAAKHGRSDTSVTVEEVSDSIEVSVADDGPGVSPEVRAHLFEWGSRGPRSSGQGIGLHIAQDLTRRHGGHLMLREAPRGATFVARFPRAR